MGLTGTLCAGLAIAGLSGCGTDVAERSRPPHLTDSGAAPARVFVPDAGAITFFVPPTSPSAAPPGDGAVGYPACAMTSDGGPSAHDAAPMNIPTDGGDLTVLLVFDKSTSMDLRWDDRSRWQAASDAMIAGIAPVLARLTVGAILFPQISECNVAPLEHPIQIDFAPGPAFVSTWLARACWPKEAWGTPLELALSMADRVVTKAAKDGALQNRFRVLVVTDGEPTCNDDPTRLVNYAAEWNKQGVVTYVLGLPGSEAASELLDSLAAAGGTGKHQSPGSPGEFRDQIAAAVR